MTKQAMTPGPWMVGPEYENSKSRSVWFGSFADHATTVCRFVRTEEDAQAIAALPDLVAALQGFSKCGYKDSHGGWIKCAPNDADLESARTALRKAGVTE